MTTVDAQALVRLGTESEGTKKACARLDEMRRTLEAAVKRSLPYLAHRKVPVIATVRSGLFDELVAPLSNPRHTTTLVVGARGAGAIVLDGRVIALGLAGMLGGRGEPPELDPSGITAAQTALASRLARGLAAAFDELLKRVGAHIDVRPDAPPPAGLLIAYDIALGDGENAGRILLLLSKDAIDLDRSRPPQGEPMQAAVPAIGNVELELVVDLGRLKMPLSKLASLRVGDVLRLPLAVDAPVRLHVGGRSLFVGRPTTRGTQIALEILASSVK